MKNFTALDASAILYFNWKFAKKIFAHQFREIIEPYKKTILKKCDEKQTSDVVKALGNIFQSDTIESNDMGVLKKDFLLYTAAAADIIIQRQMDDRRNAMPIPSKN